MSENIINEVIESKRHFIFDTGFEPEYLYVSCDVYNEIISIAKGDLVGTCILNKKDEHGKIVGLKLIMKPELPLSTMYVS